eukprot:14630543-Alexandrium_andersonii.AAC.1
MCIRDRQETAGTCRHLQEPVSSSLFGSFLRCCTDAVPPVVPASYFPPGGALRGAPIVPQRRAATEL